MVGVSAALASGYLVKHLSLPVVADITSDDFPQSASITEWEVTNGVRIHGNSKICVLVSDFAFAAGTESTVRALLKLILDFCQRHNIRSVGQCRAAVVVVVVVAASGRVYLTCWCVRFG